VPRETLENISLLYLGAIRNAETDLRPAKTSQIAGILYSVANETDRKRIEDMLVKTNHSIATDSAVKKTEEIINRNLLNIEKDEMNEQVHISLIDPQFDSVATALKIDYVSERYLKITKEELKAILDEFSLTEDDIKEFIITGRNDPNKKFVNLKKLYGNITYTKLYDRLPNSDISLKDWKIQIEQTLTDFSQANNIEFKVNEVIKTKMRVKDDKLKDFIDQPIKNFFAGSSKEHYTNSTIHSVKGCTFEAVMLIVSSSSKLTENMINTKPIDSEEIRTFYVAATRARKLFVLALPDKKKAAMDTLRLPKELWDYKDGLM